MRARGLFVVLYGPEGVGKSRQAGLLEERLRDEGVLVRRVRYPVYEAGKTGAQLDEMLHRKKISLDEKDMQKLFAKNRKEFEPTLKAWLNSGMTVIAEGYKGTGIVWGVTRGLTVEQMDEINEDTLDPDLSIYIDGPMRTEMADPAHPYGDEEEWYQLRKTYFQMADRYGWIRVGGDAPILTVASRIWAVVKPVVGSR